MGLTLGWHKVNEGRWKFDYAITEKYENGNTVDITYTYPAFCIMVFDTLEQESKYGLVACFTDGVNKWSFTKTTQPEYTIS